MSFELPDGFEMDDGVQRVLHVTGRTASFDEALSFMISQIESEKMEFPAVEINPVVLDFTEDDNDDEEGGTANGILFYEVRVRGVIN